MAHKLERFSKSILDQPQFIIQEKLEEISHYFDNRNSGIYEQASLANEKLLQSDSRPFIQDEDLETSNVGVLEVEGTLTYKPSFWAALCGGCSYVQLLEEMDILCEMEDIDTILMRVNSGGGEAFRCFQTAKALRSKADSAGKRLIAYVDGLGASAAYALPAAAHEIIVNPDSTVGSIGVVVALLNDSKKMQKEGLERTFITAGASKVPFDKEGGFREEFLADLQERVAELYDNFVEHVATFRDIDEQVVRNTEAKVFSANKALELGLIDGIMEEEEFLEYLSTYNKDSQEKSERQSKVDVIKVENVKTEVPQMAQEDKTELSVSAEQLAQLEKLADLEKMVAAYQAKETEQAKAEKAEELSQYAFLGDSKDAVLSFLMDSEVSESHKETMNTLLGNVDKAFKDVEAKAVEDIAAAEELVKEAEAAKDAVKEEFALKEHGDTSVPDANMSVTDRLAAKVAAKKKQKAAK